jgi:D-alanyl-D-alanine carboxypeptidase
MRFYRISFIGGLAIGYVLGAQAGRERYEQMKQLARKAAESPAMQQTAGALQAQAQATAKTAKDKATTSVRKGASKVTKRSAASGRTSTARRKSGSSGSTAASNGAMPRATGSDDSRPFVPVNGSFSHHDLIQ